MADNVAITPGSGATAAADDIGGVLHQRIKLTLGADGVSDGDVSSTNPIPVRLDQGPEGIISSNGSLQVDATQSNEMSAESLNAPNATLLGDEPVQMVGLHPSYPLPIDTATPMPIAGRNPAGAFVPIKVAEDGSVQPQDSKEFRFEIGRTANGVNISTPPIDCSGFSTISFQIDTAYGGNTNIFVEVSNNGSTWVPTQVIRINFGQQTIIQNSVTQAYMPQNQPTPSIWVLHAVTKYFRLRTGYAGAALHLVHIVLRSGVQTPFVATNLNLISGAPISTASAQLGVNSFNTLGPTAPGSAHDTNNPLQMSGSDGTNVRRILTDTSGNTRVVGPLAAGTSLIGATNAAFAPNLIGIADLEGKVQRATGDVRGRVQIKNEDSTAADDGIIDALNNVVRELKLLNAKITDLPYWLGINSVMPDDGQSFRDDPTLFNQ